jgi:F0F1-type ATP synthase gamma subunit
MVGTSNIEKITKSMKMVSAAKLRGDQSRLSAATPFAVSLFLMPAPCTLLVATVFNLTLSSLAEMDREHQQP